MQIAHFFGTHKFPFSWSSLDASYLLSIFRDIASSFCLPALVPPLGKRINQHSLYGRGTCPHFTLWSLHHCISFVPVLTWGTLRFCMICLDLCFVWRRNELQIVCVYQLTTSIRTRSLL